jgi:hypothetical protein
MCWALGSLAEAACGHLAEGYEKPGTSLISPYFETIIEHLISTLDRPDVTKGLRVAAVEGVNSMVSNCPSDCYESSRKASMFIIGKLSAVLSQQSPANQEEVVSIVSALCSSLQVMTENLRKEDALHAAPTIVQVRFRVVVVSMWGVIGPRQI